MVLFFLHIVGSILFQKIKAISSNEIDKKRETTQSDILISRLSNDESKSFIDYTGVLTYSQAMF